MQSVLTKSHMSVVKPSGHINAANAADFQQELTSVLSSRQASTVLVDMAQVESLDSAGLMALVAALTTAQQMGLRFALCGISPSIRIIFEVTQLDRAFEIFAECSSFEKAVA
ncbi:MAG TPA: STAS domain-containing protein [Chroococcidiopsis sp.]